MKSGLGKEPRASIKVVACEGLDGGPVCLEKECQESWAR